MRLRALRPAAALLAALLPAAGCGWDTSEEFTPSYLVEKMRILAVRAEPPEIAPGGRTRLDALVVDPDEGDRPLTWLWILCDPDPTGLLGTACDSQEAARDPSALLKGETPGVRVVPALTQAEYAAPADVLARLAPGSVERRRGLTAAALLIVFEGTDPAKIRDGTAKSQFAIKRIRIADPGPAPNANPRLAALAADGQELPEAAPAPVRLPAQLQLRALAAEGSAQKYERVLADGATKEETEALIFSWFVDAGVFPDFTPRASRTFGEEVAPLRLPAGLQPPAGRVHLWVVLRDARGGADWMLRSLAVSP